MEGKDTNNNKSNNKNDKGNVIIQVLGPTGVGKSRVAVGLATELGGEVISADSMQVYRGFDIGTDKIDDAGRRGIPHHLIDLFSDCSQFNASLFLERSFAVAEDIVRRGRLPIVCGGTALYLRTMIKGIFPESGTKRVSRESLRRIARRVGLGALWDKLHRVDPHYAQKVGRNDEVRILRALEIFYNNGRPPSDIFKETRTPFHRYRFIRIGLNTDRAQLYRRIEERVDRMMERGLEEETRKLAARLPDHCPPFKALGYREMLMFLRGEIRREEAVALIKQHSRNFAKRQLSWFRNEADIRWFAPGELAQIRAYIQSYIQGCIQGCIGDNNSGDLNGPL